MDHLEEFLVKVKQAGDDWSAITSAFSDHFASDFLPYFVSQEIRALRNEFEHIVPKSVNQTTFTFVSNEDIEYSVRILMPFPIRPHPIKWLGMRQAIGLKGPGSITVRKLSIRRDSERTASQAGIVVDAIELLKLQKGDIIVGKQRHDVIEIFEVENPTVVEVLTYRRDNDGVIWTFDQNLKSAYGQQSSPLTSRIRNALDLAHTAGTPVPDHIYNLLLDPSHPERALLAIRSMLLSGHPDAFLHLQRAVHSDIPDLNWGARRLFQAMTQGSDGPYATGNRP